MFFLICLVLLRCDGTERPLASVQPGKVGLLARFFQRISPVLDDKSFRRIEKNARATDPPQSGRSLGGPPGHSGLVG